MFRPTKEEKKIWALAGIAFVILFLFFVFVFIPKSKAVMTLKARVAKNDELLSDIRRLIGNYVSLAEGGILMRKHEGELNLRFIDRKDIFLAINRLSEAADAAGVRIISVTPQSLSPFSAKGGSNPKFYGRSCLKQPVKLVAEGRYEQLANYLQLLEQSPIGVYTIDSISVAKEKSFITDLKMDAVIGLYVFGDGQ